MWIGLPSLVLRTDWRARRRTRTAELLRSRRGGFVAPLLTPDRPVIVIWEDNQDSAYRIWGDVPSSSKAHSLAAAPGGGRFSRSVSSCEFPAAALTEQPWLPWSPQDRVRYSRRSSRRPPRPPRALALVSPSS